MRLLSLLELGLIRALVPVVSLYLNIKVRNQTHRMESILWDTLSPRILKQPGNQSLWLISYYRAELYRLLNLFHTQEDLSWSGFRMELKRMRKLMAILEEHMESLHLCRREEIFWESHRAHSMDC